MIYLMGDLQGCCDALDQLLAKLDFSPSRDRLYVLGDLVNRGPRSLDVLRRLEGFGESATSLLGNHDLHLLALAHGVGQQHRGDTLGAILAAPERDRWIAWLRQQRMAVQAHGWLMVHAGVVPQWDADKALALAGEIEAHLRSDELHDFLQVMYGNEPSQWREDLSGHDRLRFTINVLTRLRFCTIDGRLDLTDEGWRRLGSRRLLPVVRRARPQDRRRAHCVRALVDARARRAHRPAGDRHRLRVGRTAHGRAHRRRPPRGDPGALRRGAQAGLSRAWRVEFAPCLRKRGRVV